MLLLTTTLKLMCLSTLNHCVLSVETSSWISSEKSLKQISFPLSISGWFPGVMLVALQTAVGYARYLPQQKKKKKKGSNSWSLLCASIITVLVFVSSCMDNKFKHGPDECLINTVEACAVNLWPDPVNQQCFCVRMCVWYIWHSLINCN